MNADQSGFIRGRASFFSEFLHHKTSSLKAAITVFAISQDQSEG